MTDEVAFAVDLSSGRTRLLPEITLQAVGLRERADLQRWIMEFPQVVEAGLLLVTSEFDQWELREQRVPDRLDVLFMDSEGSPVIVELKRDRAADTTDLQALKYAAYCSQLTVQDLAEQFARFHDVTFEEARARVLDHAPSLAEGEPGPVRVRLIAGSFGPAVTTLVLWLFDLGLDIGCVQVTARQHDEATAVLSARRLLPLPQAEDYLVRRRRREHEEDARKIGSRGANSIKVLAEAGALAEGDVLALGVETLNSKWRADVSEFLSREPDAGFAEWTGEPVARSLRWRYDGDVYSATGLTKRILAFAGHPVEVVPGPDFWLLPDGRPMYRASVEIRRAETG